jgi:S-sulfo-L-cysteine synthase (3-phospho-L-serine-dependent)
MKKAFIFVESNTSGTGQLFASTAVRLGFVPVLLAADAGKYSYVAEDGIEFVQVDTSDCAALRQSLNTLEGRYSMRGIYSSSEYFIETAARLAAERGLPAENFEAIRTCRNKNLQRQKLKEAGIRIPRFQLLSLRHPLELILSEIPLPVIIKPNAGTGSMGVRLCRTVESARAHAALLLDRTVNERGMRQVPEVLVEEYMTGSEYSVEILGGSVIGICAKHVSPEPFFVETGHDFPAPLPKLLAQQIRRLALSGARAMGLQWGAVHVEIRNTPKGPAIVEINPRLAGGFIPELVRLATGVDLIEAVLRRAVGEEARLQRTVEKHASIRFILPPADGVLSAVGGTGTGSMQNEVADIRMYRKPGENVRIHHDFRDRIGHVIACAETGTSARETAAAVRDKVRVCIS